MGMLILVAWGFSFRACWATNVHRGHIKLTDGALFYYQGTLTPGLHRFDTMGQLGFRWPRVKSSSPFDSTLLVIPLWLLLLLSAAPAAAIAIQDQRSPGPGRCKRCQYDLTGNVSGVCPECGVKLENSHPV